MIDEKMNQLNQLPIEETLHTLFHSATPDAAFVDRLERQLLAQQGSIEPLFTPLNPLARLRRLWSALGRPFRRPRLATAVLVLFLALLTTLTIIGPRRVLAGIQTWLGYVPGIGFLDLDNTRVLSAPVVQEREGVSLQIEQAIAGPEETIIVLSSTGLPSAAEVGTDSEHITDPVLHLEDGTTLEIKESQFSYGRGRFTFPPLPSGVYRVTLALEWLPLVPLGIAPQQWRVPFILQPASGELVAELFPQPYIPAGAEVTHDGVTLRVIGVAQTADSTAVQTEVDWENPEWRHFSLSGGRSLPYLRDDLGHTYHEIHENLGNVAVARVTAEEAEAPTPDPTLSEDTQTYAPVSPAARRLTLVVDALDFNVLAEDVFTVNLGEHPQIGDEFPLDVTLDVVGIPVQITGARLVEVEEQYMDPDRVEMKTTLAFEIAPAADMDGRGLRSIGLQTSTPGFRGGSTGGLSYDEALDRYQMRAALVIAEGDPIPAGEVTVQVTGASVWLLGPWEISWTVPNAADSDAGIQPRTLQPAATVTHDDVTVGVEAMTLTDRVTAVQLNVNHPHGRGEVFPYGGITFEEHALYLLDNRGRRYEPLSFGVRWEPDGPRLGEAPDPNQATFAALDPLARHVTLNIPAVLVNIADTAVVEVTVPEGITLQPNENPDLPKLSDPWAIDIPITIAGYPVHFIEAWLREVNPGELVLELVSAELPQPEDGRWLRRLNIGRAVGPTGSLPESQWNHGMAGLTEPPRTFRVVTVSSDGTESVIGGPELPRTYKAGLGIEISAAVVDGAAGGTYRIELTGADVQVEGPWQLEIDLP